MKLEILFLVCQQNIFSNPHMATPMKNSEGTPASQTPILKCLEELNMFAIWFR